MEILAAMERFAGGDLTVALAAEGDDVMARLRRGVTATAGQIRTMVMQVHEVLYATAAASQEIHASTEDSPRARTNRSRRRRTSPPWPSGSRRT